MPTQPVHKYDQLRQIFKRTGAKPANKTACSRWIVKLRDPEFIAYINRRKKNNNGPSVEYIREQMILLRAGKDYTDPFTGLKAKKYKRELQTARKDLKLYKVNFYAIIGNHNYGPYSQAEGAFAAAKKGVSQKQCACHGRKQTENRVEQAS